MKKETIISRLNYIETDICQFCKKVCTGGDRGLSLHMHHNKECFQKMTNMTKLYHKHILVHSQMHNSSCNQEYEHQDKKSKLIVILSISFNNTMISMIAILLVFKHTIKYHQYLNRFF